MRMSASLLGVLVFQLSAGASEGLASGAIQFQRDVLCQVTAVPDRPFMALAPYPSNAPYSNFWHGHDGLWTMLQNDGRWAGLPRN